jgi:hypothetical protein
MNSTKKSKSIAESAGFVPPDAFTFVHAATKVSKNAFTPCGGHLLCQFSETSNDDGA